MVHAVSRRRWTRLFRSPSFAQPPTAPSHRTPGVTAPIVGSTSLKNIEDSIGAVQVKLTDEEYKSISEGYVPKSIVSAVFGDAE